MSENSQTWKRAALAGVAFGVLFAGATAAITYWIPGTFHGGLVLATGILAGALFGILIGLFATSGTVARQTAIALAPGEVMAFDTAANHFRNAESRGGRLYLTDAKLMFRPHRFNLQAGDVVIPRGEIAGAEPFLTLGVIPNGLKVMRRDGSIERFVVANRAEWLRQLAPRVAQAA